MLIRKIEATDFIYLFGFELLSYKFTKDQRTIVSLEKLSNVTPSKYYCVIDNQFESLWAKESHDNASTLLRFSHLLYVFSNVDW